MAETLDSDAEFKAFYERHWKYVYRLCFTYMKSEYEKIDNVIKSLLGTLPQNLAVITEPEIPDNGGDFNFDDKFGDGVKRFVTGLGKKALLANYIGLLWDAVSKTDAARLSTAGAWLEIIAFSFQIYFDFSGYSDIAIGLGKIFGFDFCKNFNYPYTSKNVTEFWRR